MGIKTLKSRLSEFLRQVRAGETILVTDRNDVIAELRPAHRHALVPSSFEDALNRLADTGKATLRTESPKTWGGITHSLSFPVDSADLLNELRKEK